MEFKERGGLYGARPQGAGGQVGGVAGAVEQVGGGVRPVLAVRAGVGDGLVDSAHVFVQVA